MRVLLVLSSVIPGLPLLLHGRYAYGLLLFLFGSASWILHGASHLRVGDDRGFFLATSFLGGLICTALTVAWSIHWTSEDRIEKTRREVEAALDEA